ncbi:MAG: hypothetical protein Q4D05_08950 [Acinetobacter sp.]|nr:hypothetical protein [Acinetobacter sp.]
MIETLIVALVVLWSIYIVFKKVFPSSYNRLFTALADRFAAMGWVKLAQWLRPAGAMGCGGGCGCKASDAPPPTQAVKWK